MNKISKGEKLISNILKQSKIVFEKEKIFIDLKWGKLRYDFYLPNENIIIEYDGEGHYKYIPFFHKNKAAFNKSRERDRQKNSYCIGHNIKLYRIPYWDYDKIKTIDDILNEEYLVKTKWHTDDLIAKLNKNDRK